MSLVLDRPGLVLVDLQRGFLDPNGAYARAGRAVRDAEVVVAACARLREAFRAADRPRWFTAYRYRPDGFDYPARLHRLLPTAYASRADPVFVPGSPDTEIVFGLEPRADEPVVYKNRYSGFYGTDLAARLRDADVRTVVIAGVLSHVCVEATARDAFAQDFDVAVVRDAVAGADASLHRAALRDLEETVGAVPESREVVTALGQHANP